VPSAGISDSSRLHCDNKGISSFLSMTYGKSLGSFVLAKLQVVGWEIQPLKHNYCIIFDYKNLLIGVYLGAYTGPVGRGFSRFFAMTRLGGARRSPAPQRWQNRYCLAFPYQLAR